MLVENFEQLKEQVLIYKDFVEVTEDLFEYALGVLPPKMFGDGLFAMGECYSMDLYYYFVENDGKFYGCLCNKNFAIANNPRA